MSGPCGRLVFCWETLAGQGGITAVPAHIAVQPNPETVAKNQTNNILVQIEGLKTHFPIRKGLLQRLVGHVRAVDGVDLVIHRGETVDRKSVV